MQNENIQNNQSNQIKRNPSRGNTNVNQGEANERNLGAKELQNGNSEADTGEQSLNEEADFSGSEVNSSQADGISDQGNISERQQGGRGSEQTKSGNEAALHARGKGDDGGIGQQEIQQQQQQPVDGDAGRSNVDAAGAGAGYGATSESEEEEVEDAPGDRIPEKGNGQEDIIQ